MDLKIVLTVLMCLYIQAKCETVQEVMSELRPKVNALQRNIGLMIGENRRQLGSTREQINQEANTAQNEIKLKVNNLNNIIDNLKNNATKSNTCINSAQNDLNGLELNGFQFCKQSKELNKIGFHIGGLGRAKGLLRRALSLCLYQNRADVDGLRNCIENQISTADSQSSTINKNVQDTLHDSLNQAIDCIEITRNNLKKEIENITGNLEKCN